MYRENSSPCVSHHVEQFSPCHAINLDSLYSCDTGHGASNIFDDTTCICLFLASTILLLVLSGQAFSTSIASLTGHPSLDKKP